MANILLTSFCNRRCPYCFAQEKIESSTTGNIQNGDHMPFENLVKAADFLEKSANLKVNLLGGEPTLHPQFLFFVKYMLGRGFMIRIFTNGMIKKSLLDEIEKLIVDEKISSNRLRFVVNINEKRISPEKEYHHQIKTLEAIGRNCSVSFNYFEPECELGFTVDLIREYEMIREVRLGLAHPIVNKDNSCFHPEQYPQMMKKVVALSDYAGKYDIVVNLDCGFTMCSLSDEDMGRMFRNNARIRFSCDPCIDIGIDLKVWHCFPLGDTHEVSLEDFEDQGQLVRHFHKHYEAEYKSGVFDECTDCQYLLRHQCAGGCMGHYYGAGRDKDAATVETDHKH